MFQESKNNSSKTLEQSLSHGNNEQLRQIHNKVTWIPIGCKTRPYVLSEIDATKVIIMIAALGSTDKKMAMTHANPVAISA